MKVLQVFAPRPWKITALTILAFLSLYLVVSENPLLFPFLEQLELKTIDLRFRLRGDLPPAKQVAAVLIDDASLDQYGRWPWNRKILANLVQTIAESKPSTIVFDIVFTDPDPYNASPLIENILTQYQGADGFRTYLSDLARTSDPDYDLALALQSGPPTVLGYFFYFNTKDIPERMRKRTTYSEVISPSQLKMVVAPGEIIESKAFPLLIAKGALSSTPSLGKATPHHGFLDAHTDLDGTMRRTNLLISFQGNIYPSLALKAASLHLGKKIGTSLGPQFVKKIFLEEQNIPVDPYGRFFINYRGDTQSIPTYSANQILEGKFEKGAFEQRVVFIGVTAKGLGDVLTTPVSKHHAGVLINAHMTDNLITRDFVSKEAGLELAEMGFLILGAILLALALKHLRARSGAVFTLLFLSAFIYGNFEFAFKKGKLIAMALPLLEMLFLYTALTVYKFFVEEKRSRQIRRAFEHYLSPVVVEQLVKNPELLKLGGEERVITVLFSDIRGFTTLSEQLSPKKTTHLLNSYLTEMTTLVQGNRGMVDKFVGDEIMALYGAPVPLEQHQLYACRTGLSMISKLRELCREWEKQGLPAINIGVGIHTGSVYVGNMGSKDIFDYTAIGDSVNLGARLEGTNKVYGTNVIISEECFQGLKEILICRELDFIRVRGKKEPTRIYEVISEQEISALDEQVLNLFAEGLKYYREREWEKASGVFEKALSKKSTDKPSEVFLERISHYKKTPPASDWDGVFVMTSK